MLILYRMSHFLFCIYLALLNRLDNSNVPDAVSSIVFTHNRTLSEDNRYATLHIGTSEIACKVATPASLRCLHNSFT